MSNIRAPWKCPYCRHITSKQWNMKSPIEKKHGGQGAPEQIHNRRESAFSQALNTPNFGHSTSQNIFSEYIVYLNIKFFNPRDPIEGTLATEFEGCIPHFLDKVT